MSPFDPMAAAWQLHFRCVFDLRMTTPGTEPWATLVKTVRAWIREKEQAPEIAEVIGKRWFFEGGRYAGAFGQRRVSIETRRLAGNGSLEEPECWALRYDHSADDPKTFRTWRTDIAVHALSGGVFRFALRVSNALHVGFVGAEPAPATPSAPKIVTKLLTSVHWQALAGTAALRAVPQVLTVGQGAQFLQRLADPDRRCPLLLLSADPATGHAKLDASRLARVLAGTAQVVVATDPEVAEELRYLLPYPLRCSGGTVRMYRPGVRLEEAETDFRRHRFFRVTDIDAASQAVIEAQLVAAVARRLPVGYDHVVWSLEDVVRRERETRFAALRAQLATSEDRELLQLFEDDNVALQKDNRDLQDLVEQRDDELAVAQEGAKKLAYQRDIEKKRAEAAEHDACVLRKGQVALATIGLPGSIPELMDWVTAFWGDRIVFTDRARKSAARAAINKERSELQSVWQVLRSLATELHPLLEQESPDGGTIPDLYKQRSGFELTWTEGKQTKKDPKLMQLRKLDYDGQTLDITPHVKYSSKSHKYLRVHFAVHEASGAIIVGHCGDHLETYGTQWVD
ncbi:MAG: hypothetical protein ACM3NQ_24325 [Bacteroidales bacterium]